MGRKLILLVLSCLCLAGCKETTYVPYQYVAEGTYLCNGMLYEDGVPRNASVTDKAALQYVVSEDEIALYPYDITYDGDLYSLSNYRSLLLQAGYTVVEEVRTDSLLDTTLTKGNDKVRLIYQPAGSIRILFKNQQGPAHILLEGVR